MTHQCVSHVSHPFGADVLRGFAVVKLRRSDLCIFLGFTVPVETPTIENQLPRGVPDQCGQIPDPHRLPSAFQIHRDYSFLDYILGGCQLMFTVSLSLLPLQAAAGRTWDAFPKGLSWHKGCAWLVQVVWSCRVGLSSQCGQPTAASLLGEKATSSLLATRTSIKALACLTCYHLPPGS